jgi:hypothetical protein
MKICKKDNVVLGFSGPDGILFSVCVVFGIARVKKVRKEKLKNE